LIVDFRANIEMRKVDCETSNWAGLGLDFRYGQRRTTTKLRI